MTHSEQINEIGAALAKAQGKIQNAVKAAENPGFKRGNSASRYADLASVWDACREHLSANGISVVQAPQADGQKVTVETLLVHSSGQWIRDALSTNAADARAQAIGSAITYLRRYALAAMVGVAPADDDGEAAEGRDTSAGRPVEPPKSRAETVKARVAAQARPVPADSEARKKDIRVRMEKARIPGNEMAATLGEWIGRPVDASLVMNADDWTRANTALEQLTSAAETLARAQHATN